jgi:hypothetical protein
MSSHRPVKAAGVTGRAGCGKVPVIGLILSLLALLLVPSAHAAEAPPSTNAPVGLPVPLLPSPVRVIRELLARPEAQRAEMLAMYPPGLREPVEAKVREYGAMTAEARELRFLATDLRHYLMQLLPLDPATRRLALSQVPESIREAVDTRLTDWEILLPEMQAELLANEPMVRYFTQIGITSEALRTGSLDITPPDQRAPMERKIAEWNALPEETRTRVFAHFNQLFELTSAEQDRALQALSDTERDAMREALDSFANLTVEQRQVCVRSFEKFSRMTLGERRQFLQKAEIWSRMTATERELWKELVSRVRDLPPFPPGFEPRIQIPAASTATNKG